MSRPTWRESQEAALALLEALGVSDRDRVVSFTLVCRADDVPRLFVERDVGAALAGEAARQAAAALAPVVVEGRAP